MIRTFEFLKRASWLKVTMIALALPLTGCDLLKVTDPDIVTPENLLDELGLATLRNGALGEFTLAYSGSGSTDGIIMSGGLMADEWLHSGTFTTRFLMETRNVANDNGTMNGMFARLQRARNSLEFTATQLQGAGGAATDERIGEMLTFAGYSYIAFAENYCSGVPFSQETADSVIWGPPTATNAILDLAIARFNAALVEPASATMANAARVGLGRALLNKGDYAAAASAVASVPTDFAKYLRHNTNAQRNQIYTFNVDVGRWSLADGEGVNGLNFRTAGDPRITSALCPGCAFDTSEQVPGTPAVGDNWQFTNYDSWDDPVPLATGVEARLIEAEAQLAASSFGAWLTTLNDLRADFSTVVDIIRGDAGGSLAPLADPGNATGREDLMFRERAFWLFSTGHRLGDLRRLVRQYGRGSETVFPTGTYFKPGAAYGTDVNWIVPQPEDNNANFSGCIDRNA